MSITGKILVLGLFQGLLSGCLCQTWEFPTVINGLVGSCVEIPCTLNPQGNPGTFSTIWYLNNVNYLQIFNSWGSSSVLKGYKDRTSLVPGKNSCSLRIDPVRADDDEYYYPGIAERLGTNAWSLNDGRTVRLRVTDTPRLPEVTGSTMMIEGHPETVECSVVHTCASSPPSLKWNKPGQTESQSQKLFGGDWREILSLRVIPSYEDNYKPIQCTATYHNGITSQRAATLDIKYAPKYVRVSLTGNKAPLEGDDVTLICSTVASYPRPHTYEWYRANSVTKLRHQDQKIVLRNVSKDTERYSCAAINSVGRGESPLTEIPVQYAPSGVQVVVLPLTERVTELKCSFVRSRAHVTHYTWIKDGHSLLNKTGQILALDGNEDKSGSYTCVAHNTAGNSTSAELEFNGSEDSASYEDRSNLLLILGILAGVILLVVIVYIYTRIRACKTSSSHESADATYTDLVISEVSNDYAKLKPTFPAQPAAGPRDSTPDHDYENLQRNT